PGSATPTSPTSRMTCAGPPGPRPVSSPGGGASEAEVLGPGDDRLGGRDGLVHVGLAEDLDVGEQAEEVVRGQVLLPVAGHRMLLGVAREDLLEVRGVEEGEHREVLEA